MASILVVCTGNVCRSPVAEGLLRSALRARFGEHAPSVASAGIAGWEGSAASSGSVEAAAERGIDISSHRARRIRGDQLESATLVLAMAGEHRADIAKLVPGAATRAFTLKELVRLLEALPDAAAGREPEMLLAVRVSEAHTLRLGGFEGNRHDEDVADPLGMPIEAYRAIAWELEEWCVRLTDGLFGRTPARVVADGT